MSAYIPASWVESGYVPDVCVIHGQPTADRTLVRFSSRLPAWIYPPLVFGGVVSGVLAGAVAGAVGGAVVGGIVGLVFDATTRKKVVGVLPFCPDCRVLRVRNGVLGLALLVVGGLGLTFGVLGFDGSGLALFLVVAAVLGQLVGLAYAVRTTPSALVGGEATRDGQWVRVRRPSPAFAEVMTRWIAAASAPRNPADHVTP